LKIARATKRNYISNGDIQNRGYTSRPSNLKGIIPILVDFGVFTCV
jgi:hypothetical protein